MRSYHNIDYIMANLDVEATMASLGFRFTKRSGDNLEGWCPDHHVFTGHVPSHPKWYVNVKTGKTYCFTESRGSNLLYVIARAYNVSEKQAYNILTQGLSKAPNRLQFAIEQRKERQRLYSTAEKPVIDVSSNVTLNSMKEVIGEQNRTERTFKYFARNGIRPETLIDFGIVEVTNGKYIDRAIVPFYSLTGEFVGFIALDLLGKREWVRRKAHRFLDKQLGLQLSYSLAKQMIQKLRDGYKKGLYCEGTSTGSHLFGFERLLKKGPVKTVILVEGEKDTIKMQQEGFPAVGTHGNHCTDDQRSILKSNGVERVFVAFDGDKAGWEGGDKVVSGLQGLFEVFNVKLPQGKDPKDYNHVEFQCFLDRSAGETVSLDQTRLTNKATKLGERIRRWKQIETQPTQLQLQT